MMKGGEVLWFSRWKSKKEIEEELLLYENFKINNLIESPSGKVYFAVLGKRAER